MPDKLEGLAILDPSTIVVANDNDFDIGKFDKDGANDGRATRAGWSQSACFSRCRDGAAQADASAESTALRPAAFSSYSASSDVLSFNENVGNAQQGKPAIHCAGDRVGKRLVVWAVVGVAAGVGVQAGEIGGGTGLAGGDEPARRCGS